MPKQNGAAGQEILRTMRIQTLLSATGDSVVESYVAIAKQEAQAAAKASGGGMAAIREAVEKAETETRAKYENGAQSDLSGIDVTGLSAAVDVYTEAVKAYAEVEAQSEDLKHVAMTNSASKIVNIIDKDMTVDIIPPKGKIAFTEPNQN